jgi:hypothetical protein
LKATPAKKLTKTLTKKPTTEPSVAPNASATAIASGATRRDNSVLWRPATRRASHMPVNARLFASPFDKSAAAVAARQRRLHAAFTPIRQPNAEDYEL